MALSLFCCVLANVYVLCLNSCTGIATETEEGPQESAAVEEALRGSQDDGFETLWGLEEPALQFFVVSITSFDEMQGNYLKAVTEDERLLKQAIALNRPESVLVRIRLGLAENLIETDRWREAQPLIDECRVQCQKFAPVSMRMKEVEEYQTRVHINNGKFDGARKSLNLVSKQTPPSYKKNDQYRIDLNKLECLLAAKSQPFNVAREKFDQAFKDLRYALHYGSDEVGISVDAFRIHKRTYQLLFDWYCQSFADEMRQENPDVATFYKNVIAFKGLSTAWLSTMNRRQRQRGYLADQISMELELQEMLELQMSEMDQASVERVEQLKQHRASKLKAIDIETDPKGFWRTEIDSQNLCDALLPDEVFVDFVTYREGKKHQLLALVAQKHTPVRCLNLGDVESLCPQVIAWNEGQGESVAAQKAGVEIRKRLWDPLEPMIEGSNRIIVSPDGVVGYVAFGSLPSTRPGKFLIHDYMFSYQASASCLVRDRLFTESPAEAPTWCLFGNPAFEEPETDGKQRFSPLPATQVEVETIAKLVDSNSEAATVMSFTGEKARIGALRRFSRESTHIHLATHGFHEVPVSLQPKQRGLASGSIDLSSHEYVGLAFAKGSRGWLGWSTPKSTITAAEIQNLDLSKARLVVLSGCETGTGVWDHGEGMASLNQAFHVAGAQQVVSSVWPVSDSATRQLMEQFYINLIQRNLPAEEALHRAKLWMIDQSFSGVQLASAERSDKVVKRKVRDDSSRLASSPYRWGGFIISGTTSDRASTRIR